ncbi:hypothetical protein ACS0TY_002770 [Phlomoides rotata]
MIVRVGFLVAASIAAYAVKQINVKSPKREDDLKKPSDLENDDALINEEEEKLHVTCSNNGLNEVVEKEEEKEEVKLINSIINPAPSSPPDYEDDFLPKFKSLLSTAFVKGRIVNNLESPCACSESLKVNTWLLHWVG